MCHDECWSDIRCECDHHRARCRRCSIAAPISSIARLVFDRSDHLASRSRKASSSTSRTHLASRWRWRWTCESSVLSNISRRCICATWDEPDQRQCDRSSRSQTQRRRTRAFCTGANGEMVFARSDTRMETPLHRPNWPRSPTPTSSRFRSAAEDGPRRRTISCWRSRDRWFDQWCHALGSHRRRRSQRIASMIASTIYLEAEQSLRAESIAKLSAEREEFQPRA